MESFQTEEILKDLVLSTMQETKPQRDASKVVTPNHQSQLIKRVSRLLRKQENKLCSDCSKSNPRWITILSIPSLYATNNDKHNDAFLLGGFCCLECSGAHRRLGTHISFVRSIELDTLKESDVHALECGGGNGTVNKIFEGELFNKSMGEGCDESSFSKGGTKPDSSSSQKERELFIRNKYEKKLYCR